MEQVSPLATNSTDCTCAVALVLKKKKIGIIKYLFKK